MIQNNTIIYNSIFFDRLNIDRKIDLSCLLLHNPKRVQSKEIILNLQKKTYYSPPIQDTLEVSYPKNINNRSEKKHKNNKNILVDRLDLRKYKTKSRVKLRSQIQMNDDDLHIDYNDDIKPPSSNINKKEIRVFKQLKAKKVTKLSQGQKSLTQKNNLIHPKKELESIQKVDSNQILVKGPVSVYELANALCIPETEIIKCLFLKGICITINETLNLEIVKLVAEAYNFSVSISKELYDIQNFVPIKHDIEKYTISYKRAPIVAVLGHVDHGKTTLLDTICKISVSDKEKGGITQAICAYEIIANVGTSTEKLIFLDTPGHSAFSTMRTISTQVTDVCVLVVAADDGLQEQTLEIITKLKDNKLSYVVAINKIDKPNANVSKVRKELAEYEIIGQDLGGDIPIVEVSGLTHKHIDKLLTAIITLTHAKNLTATPKASALGTILDSYINRTKGLIASIIVQDGTLQIGDLLVCGNTISKIRAIINNQNSKVKYAGPSSVVKILGLSNILSSGDSFYVVQDNKFIKKELYYKNKNLKNSFLYTKPVNYSVNLNSNNIFGKHINLIVKTETHASIDALLKVFSNIPQKKVRLNIVSVATGAITTNDIKFASVSNSIIFSFHNSDYSLPLNIKLEAEKLNISIVNFNVIYDLLEHIKNLMLDLVDIEYKENIIGNAIVESTFVVSKGLVAGCSVISGKLKQNDYIRVIRNKNIIHDGKLNSLKRLKEEVKQVFQGYDCGLLSENFNMWQKKDEIIAYELIPLPKHL